MGRKKERGQLPNRKKIGNVSHLRRPFGGDSSLFPRESKKGEHLLISEAGNRGVAADIGNTVLLGVPFREEQVLPKLGKE